MRWGRKVQKVVPGPGQESVWDYPRPPAVETTGDRVVIELGGRVIVDTTEAVRVLETSHPPVFYVPIDSVQADVHVGQGMSLCEFKGMARYLTIASGDRIAVRSAWTYPEPWPGYEPLAGLLAVYPSKMDRCEVAGETVVPQDGDFYGGWITSKVVGPFKGAAGTLNW